MFGGGAPVQCWRAGFGKEVPVHNGINKVAVTQWGPVVKPRIKVPQVMCNVYYLLLLLLLEMMGCPMSRNLRLANALTYLLSQPT